MHCLYACFVMDGHTPLLSIPYMFLANLCFFVDVNVEIIMLSIIDRL